MELVPLGDSALLVRADESSGEAAVALARVLDLAQRLRALALPGVIELVPACDSVALFYDPARLPNDPETSPAEFLTRQIEELISAKGKAGRDRRKARVVEIPVCYEEEFAPDLEAVARHTGLSAAEVVRRHHSAEYVVNCVGFTPGFPYLSGLPPELATPRRDTPRKEVPAGAVAIGGQQTGIYPQPSPGGWNIIGRTALRLFDLQNDPPALLQAGDRVRFRAVQAAQLHA